VSSPTIDYDALAKQHGGEAAIDYDALAAQHGGSAAQDAPAAPTASMQAAPQTASSYMGDVQNDLMHGGGRTVVGRAIGHMQGRGDSGMSGLESGQGEGVANMVGSVPLGVAKVAQGVTELPSQPLTGVGHIVSGGLQAATIPASFAGPEISEAASNAVSGAGNAIAGKVLPSAIKEKAAGVLQSVAHDANSVPVQLQNAGDAALRLMDWQKKTQLGPTVNKFLNRITNPKAGPLNYEEARDFYQLLGRLSVDETNKLAPPVRRDLTQMVVGLKQDIGDAADTVGRAADYYNGMKDYARGAKLQEWYDLAKKYAIRGAITGAGAVGAGTAAKFIAEGLDK